MPNNKSDLYDFFINRRLQQEDDKNIKKTSYIKRKGYYSLQKIAIAIQLMNVNDLSDNEILDLEDESDGYKHFYVSFLNKRGLSIKGYNEQRFKNGTI